MYKKLTQLAFLGLMLMSEVSLARLICENLFSTGKSSSINLNNLEKTSHLQASHHALNRTLERHLKLMTRKTISEKIKSFENEIEIYLNDNKIPFTKIPTSIVLEGLNEGKFEKLINPNFAIKYNLFKISGDRYGNDTSRMVYGINLAHKNLQIIIDPLTRYKYQAQGLHLPFESTIYLSPDSFTGKMFDYDNILRHEIQHFLENVKINKGLQSLARLTLYQNTQKDPWVYNEHFSSDEVEAYLREHRIVSNKLKETIFNRQLMQNGTSQVQVNYLNDIRSSATAKRLTYINKFITYSKESLHELAHKIKVQNITLNEAEAGPESLLIYFDKETQQVLLLAQNDNTSYQGLGLNLTGLVSSLELNNISKIKQVSLNTVLWMQNRISQIETELTKK